MAGWGQHEWAGMPIVDDALSAFRHFRVHKLRTTLVLLGIVVSVASIVVLTAIADAMRRDKAAYFEEAGARIAMVVLLNARGLELEEERPYKYANEHFGCVYDEITDFLPIKDWREAEQIKQLCPNTVKAISAILNKADAPPKMSCDKMAGDYRIYGVTDDFFNCFAPRPVAGRIFTHEEFLNNERVIVASHQLNHEYLAQMAGNYGNLEAVYGKGYDPTSLPMTLVDEEKTLYLNGIGFKVIGLLPPNRPTLEPFFRYNWCGLVPYYQTRSLSDKQGTNRFIFYPKTTDRAAFEEMKPILERMYPDATPVLRSAEAWAEQERKTLGIATTGFLIIGLATLLVAAIGIMNTTLVSVRERQLEIGVRKALGASSRDIGRQFVTETVFLSLIGIVFGLLLAFVLVGAVEYTQKTLILPALMKFKTYWGTSGAGGKSMDPRAWEINYAVVVLTSFVVAAVTLGVAALASLLPAREAAALHPVECLRRRSFVPPALRRSRLWRLAMLRPLLEDPDRTWLSVSSLSVGVALIVVLTSVGEYNRRSSNSWLREVSPDTIDFHIWEGVTMPFMKFPPFDQSFIDDVKAKCPHVREVAYSFSVDRYARLDGKYVSLRSRDVTADREFMERRRMWGTDAVSAGFVDFFGNMKMLSGQGITQEDIDRKTPVCVLDEKTAQIMFPKEDALGNSLEIQGKTFTVKGIVKEPETFGKEWWSGAYVPLSFAREILGSETTVWLSAKTTDSHLARDEIADLYEARYGVELERAKQFTMAGEAQAQQRREAWFNAALLISLAAGAMFVGGVGMMNIMLIGAAARTAELGIRRALGATRARIMGQFLAESAVLSLAGGAVGFVVGCILAEFGLPLLYLAWRQEEVWPTMLSVHWSLIALLFGLAVGTLAGLGPAIKASFVRPVEALRDE